MPVFKAKNELNFQSVATDDDILNFASPTADSGSPYVSAREALENSDIYSLIFQISSDLASAKLKADQPRAQGILNNPSSTSNARAFWQSMFAQALLDGNAYAYRFRNINGTDQRWEYLRPSQVSPFLLADGSGLIYNLSFDEPEIGVMENVPQADMIHIRLMSKNGGMTGISPLTALTSEIDIKNNVNRLTLNALKQSVTAGGILKLKAGSKLSLELKKKRASKFINDSHNGLVVLDDLEDYQPLEIKSNVANLLNQVNWTGKQIAKVYGVPDSVINGTGDQQSSIQMENNAYIKSIARYANAIVGELNNKLSANVTMDLRESVDPTGDVFASSIADLTSKGALAPNQATAVLQQAGFIGLDLPEPKYPPKGGENNGRN
ncbi:phage portal protein [Fructilactobacillus cliffordii]|uniref:phage portal protein n=1 Tax=Fructilactobacillus cliffordii TaxID=2940299 RepID=UPI002092DDEF|nr:phage portal protein [Fructilactobacillus cliffordii]USS86487.1 phage portal protein [Fructilactobacillus cliffordii]